MKSFRVQIIVVTMSTLLVFALVLFIALYSRSIQTTQRQMDKAVTGAFSQISSTFDQMRESIASCHSFVLLDGRLMLLTEKNSVRRIENVTYRLETQQAMQNIVKSFNWLEYLYMFDEEGNVVGASRKSLYAAMGNKDFPFLNSTLYQELPREPEFYFLASSTQPLTDYDLYSGKKMIYSVRQMAVNGCRYYILLGIRENMIWKNHESLANMLNGDLFLIDGNGIIASAGKKSLIGTVLPEWTEQWNGITGSWTADRDGKRLFFMNLKSSNLYVMVSVPLELYTAGAQATLRYILTVLVVCAAVFMSILSLRLGWLMRQINLLVKAMDDVGAGNLGMQVSGLSSYEFQKLALRFNAMSRRIERLIRENQQIERKQHRLEMETLRNQINPHFLYNSLNMIQWMAKLNEIPGIERAVQLLSGMVRPLYKGGPICTLEEEIEYCGMFVELCSLRYGKRIRMTVEREGVPQGLTVLRLLLQPIVENAVVHGLAEVKRGGEVRISCRIEQGALLIFVEDNGSGFEPAVRRTLQEALDRKEEAKNIHLSGGGFVGLTNVARRIAFEYGEEYGVRIADRMGGGTRMEIRLPALKCGNNIQ